MTSRMRFWPLGDGLDGAVDGDELVVAGFSVGAVGVVVLRDNLLLLIGQVSPGGESPPELAGDGKASRESSRSTVPALIVLSWRKASPLEL